MESASADSASMESNHVLSLIRCIRDGTDSIHLRDLIMNTCLECNQPTDNPRFCSRSCSATYNNRVNPKRTRTHHCRGCDSLITSNHRYCEQCREDRSIPTTVRCQRCDREYLYDYRKGHTKSLCNSCNANRHRTEAKQLCVKYKGGQCQVCGYKRCLRALSFHHNGNKQFGISGNQLLDWNKLRPELDKCVLLCANCHMELHDGIIKIGTEGIAPSSPSYQDGA